MRSRGRLRHQANEFVVKKLHCARQRINGLMEKKKILAEMCFPTVFRMLSPGYFLHSAGGKSTTPSKKGVEISTFCTQLGKP